MFMKNFINLKKMRLSLLHAFSGIFKTVLLEQNFRFHLIFIILVLITGFYLGISSLEWGFVILSIFFVLVSELFNTALERLCDRYGGGKKSKKIAIIKDISAGAVLLAALNAVIIGVIFLLIPLVKKLFWPSQ